MQGITTFRSLTLNFGYLVETSNAYPELSVRENLEAMRRLRPGTEPQAVERVFERLGLIHDADRRAGTLSLGNAQRLGDLYDVQRAVRSAAWIGMLWGPGHTLAIMLVGGVLVIFRIVISPRLGLTMELTVALMLIILGLLNLKGFVRWINETFRLRQVSESEIYHVHPHRHGDYVHSHAHRHNPEGHGHSEEATPQGWLDRTFGELRLYQALRGLQNPCLLPTSKSALCQLFHTHRTLYVCGHHV